MKPFKIVIDTREQHALSFRPSSLVEGTIVKKLDVGDYSVEGFESKIAIERKSPQDLFQTLGKGHKRFKKELERAENYEYFAIVVDAPFTTIMTKAFDSSHYSTMRGDVIIQICCTLATKYGIHFWFCHDRNESTTVIRNLFKAYMKLQKG